MKGMSETVSTASNAADAWTNPLRDPRDLRLPRIAGPCSIVIFGVTGDLSRKKLLPAIYDLANRGLLPPSFGLTGFARRDWTEDHFKDFVKENVQAHCRTPFKESTWKQLAAGIRFVQGTFDDPKAFERLSDTVAELDRDRGTRGNHAFYMSVPPRAFPQVSRQLADCGLAKSDKGAWRRVIIEKPFGHDLASAKELDRVVSEVFDPSSVFRIDHYLGKETVQNMLALRFANAMYEPIWNNNYVDHVQITMAEDIGVAGRAGYYDGIGAARDIIQNHLLQLMALTAMEEPVSFSAADLTAEKTKVLSAVRLPKDLAAHTARGQYAAGWQGSHEVVGYLDEKGIAYTEQTANTNDEVVAAASEPGRTVTNGMSVYARDGENINGALLVNVTPADFPSDHPLAGIALQRQLETAAYALTGGYAAPCQRVADFLTGRPSAGPGTVRPSYRPGVVYTDLRRCLPDFISETLALALPVLGRYLKGYDDPDALLTGVETRSSSPVRLVRDAHYEANIRGIFPCGEGAGYAGGILSAAADGMRCAEKLLEVYTT